MIKTEEKKGSYWYVFVIIGILIGAILGYYASEKGLLKGTVVGKNDCVDRCSSNVFEKVCSKYTDVRDIIACDEAAKASCKYMCS
jgi:hypothetical protein